MIGPSRHQHKRALKPLDLELHRRLARRSYWQRRLLYCGLTALAASLGALLVGAPWQVRLLCLLGGFLCGFAWPLEGTLARSLAWFDAQVGLSYRTAVERASAKGDPYGFVGAVRERVREATARLELPPAQPWWLPLVALALGLALLPALHLNLGGPQPPPFQQSTPHTQAADGSPQQNKLTSPQAGQSGAPASAPHVPKANQGAPEKAKESAGGSQAQNGGQSAAQGDAGSGGNSVAGSEAGALSQFAQQVRQSPPATSTQSGAPSASPGQQTNPFSQAANAPSTSSQGQSNQSQPGRQERQEQTGQQGQEGASQQPGQSGNQPEGSGQQTQNGQQADNSQEQGQGRQDSAQSPAASNGAPSQQGKSQQQGSSSQQSSTSQQNAQGESQGQQKGGQDQAGRTLTQGEQGSPNAPGAMSQQSGRGEEQTQSQRLQGEGAGGRSGNGAGNHAGNPDKAQPNPLGPPSGQLTYLPGEVTNGATTKSGKVMQPGTLPDTLPQGSAPAGYNHALEQAITEGGIPVEYQQILRNYFQ